MSVSIKRVYLKPSPDDGTRVLVDRLWPRGLKKEAAALDAWLRNRGTPYEVVIYPGQGHSLTGEAADDALRRTKVGFSTPQVEPYMETADQGLSRPTHTRAASTDYPRPPGAGATTKISIVATQNAAPA